LEGKRVAVVWAHVA